MSIIFCVLIVHLIIGLVLFQENKIDAYGKHADPFWDFLPVYIGYYPYVFVLYFSTTVAVITFFNLIYNTYLIRNKADTLSNFEEYRMLNVDERRRRIY